MMTDTEAETDPLIDPRGLWAAKLEKMTAESGYFHQLGANHFGVFLDEGTTLLVTFESLRSVLARPAQLPLAFDQAKANGWSLLTLIADGETWFRDPAIYAFFDRQVDDAFFEDFDRVLFYGAGMGGYAACAFVAACPGAGVVAISPQSTLDKTVVPWETRYSTAWGRDFSGAYGDAAIAAQAAGRVFLLYDPYEPLDSGHAERFEGAHVTKLRTPLLGHRLGSSLQQMGILAPITLAALNGTLTELEFYRTIRARKTFARYQRELFKRAVDRGRPDLARKLGRWVLTRGDNRYIRRGLLTL